MCGGVDYSVEISKDAQRRPGEQDRLTRRGPTKLSISFIFELGEKADRGIELFDLRNDPSLAFRAADLSATDTAHNKIVLDWFNVTQSTEEENERKTYFDFIGWQLEDEARTKDSQALLNCLELASEAVTLAQEEIDDAGNKRLRTRAEVITAMGAGKPPGTISASIAQLAARLAFRINAASEYQTAEESPNWPDNKTLCEYAAIVFNAGKLSLPSSSSVVPEPDASEVAGIQSRLTHRLTAVNIKKYTRINIKETQFLPNHLKLYETYEYTTLYVFRDMRWLLDAVKMENFPVPKEVIQETIDTLNYLYPWDRATMKLLKREGVNMHDFQDPIPDRPRFRDFKYYKPRMVDVAYEFLNPPKSWTTIWKDRRNSMQFWTFWLGLLIFFFTLGFGVAATVLAVLQLDVARHPPETE
ncbi:hypothetical protein CGCF413_v014484 [Colletotrichum fructicola]|nr:hypothetical protein CGCF413_v014484 [Colletotrichum fructicola]